MPNRIIPEHVRLAAKRAFVRTTYQGYAGTLSTGVSATAVLAFVNGEVDTTTAIVTAAVTVLAPPIAGLAAYFNISGQGIPDAYQPGTDDTGYVGRHRED